MLFFTKVLYHRKAHTVIKNLKFCEKILKLCDKYIFYLIISHVLLNDASLLLHEASIHVLHQHSNRQHLKAIFNTRQFRHLMTKMFEHSSDLAITTFCNCNFNQCCVFIFILFLNFHFSRLRHTIF